MFRRIGEEAPVAAEPVAVSGLPRPAMPMPSARPVPRPRGRPANPQLLGFAEPVTNVPPIEDFLPADAPPPEPEPVGIAALKALPATPPQQEPVPATAIPAPPAAAGSDPLTTAPPADETPLPEPAAPNPLLTEPQPKIRARVRDLPQPAPAAAEISPERPQSFVGRLGRRLGGASSAPPAPRFEPLPPPPPAPEARRAAETARPREPAPKLTTPPQAQTAERGGRPSLPRNRRLYRRATLPADIEIDGVPCTLIDVSIGGFAATGVPAQLQPNALVPVTIRLVIDGIEVGTQLKARIVYVTQSRSAGRFVELTPSQMAFLRYIVTWRGESVGAVGTTTLLDAIAGGGDRGFAPAAIVRSEFEPKSRWWAGLIGKKINPPR